MKTNVSIELTAPELDSIATLLDGKITKRLATRADINALVIKFIGGIASEANYKAGKVTEQTETPPRSDLYRVRQGEEKLLAGKIESYVYGWNKARTDGQ